MALFGKRKETKETESSACCSGASVKETTATASPTERVLVLGAGCPKCRALEQTVIQALKELGLDEPVGHVTDYAEMAQYGVMSTPALVINGKAVSTGRVLNQKEALRMLKENL